jgi:hypothetical protein
MSAMASEDYGGFRASILWPAVTPNQVLDTCIDAAFDAWRTDIHTVPSEDPPYFEFIFSTKLPPDDRVQVFETVKLVIGMVENRAVYAITFTNGALLAMAIQEAIQNRFGIGETFHQGATAARMYELLETAVFPSSLGWPTGQIVRKN